MPDATVPVGDELPTDSNLSIQNANHYACSFQRVTLNKPEVDDAWRWRITSPKDPLSDVAIEGEEHPAELASAGDHIGIF